MKISNRHNVAVEFLASIAEGRVSLRAIAARSDVSLTLLGVRLENGIYGHSRFCNTDFDDKLACLNLSGV